MSIFYRKQKSMKKSMKIQNFEISKIFRKFSEISKFWIFIDFFIENFVGKKSIFLDPENFRPKVFGFFFDDKNFRQKISDHLFRCQMIPRFRKSHLEQRATIIKLRTARTKKMFFFFVLFNVRPRPGRMRFVNLLCSSK